MIHVSAWLLVGFAIFGSGEFSRARAQESTGSFQCVGGPKFGDICSPTKDPTNQNIDCAFCTDDPDKPCTNNSECSPEGQCTGICENTPQDPVAPPSRYVLFPDDQLWVSGFDNGAMSGNFVETNSAVNEITSTSFGTNQAFSESGVAASAFEQAAGRFRDPRKGRVLVMQKIHQTPAALAYRVFSPGADSGPAELPIPSYTLPVPTNSVSNPSDIAAGDLDRRIGDDGFYHDEAVIVFQGTDDSVQVQVLDYEQDPGNVTVTGIDFDSIGKLTNVVNDRTPAGGFPGSIAVGIGDFDGDTTNEIAVVWQTPHPGSIGGLGAHLVLTILRYENDGTNPPELTILKPEVTFSQTQFPSSPLGADNVTSAAWPSLDMAVGDFDGNFIEEVAVSLIGFPFVTNQSATAIKLFVIGLDSKFDQNLLAELPLANNFFQGPCYCDPPFDPVNPESQTGWGDRAFSVNLRPRVVSGLFEFEPEKGFGLSRRQLLLTYWNVSTRSLQSAEDDSSCSLTYLTPEIALFEMPKPDESGFSELRILNQAPLVDIVWVRRR